MNDYITSREETTAEYYLRWAVEKCGKKGYVKLPCDKVLEIADCIENIRSDNRENIHGHWVDIEPTLTVIDAFPTPGGNGALIEVTKSCSVCKTPNPCISFTNYWNYCPYCGAKMD